MTMAKAMLTAGIDPAPARLRVMAEQLLRRANLNKFTACDSFMEALGLRIDDPLQRALAMHYLSEVAADMRGYRAEIGGGVGAMPAMSSTTMLPRSAAEPDNEIRSGGGGHFSRGTQGENASAPAADRKPEEGGQRLGDTQGVDAAAPPAPRKPNVSLYQRPGVRAIAADIERRSILNTHMTSLGKPVGNCSQGDLDNLAQKHGRLGWFYAALRNQMPPVGEVREYIGADEAAAIWKRAEMANSTSGAVA